MVHHQPHQLTSSHSPKAHQYLLSRTQSWSLKLNVTWNIVILCNLNLKKVFQQSANPAPKVVSTGITFKQITCTNQCKDLPPFDSQGFQSSSLAINLFLQEMDAARECLFKTTEINDKIYIKTQPNLNILDNNLPRSLKPNQPFITNFPYSILSTYAYFILFESSAHPLKIQRPSKLQILKHSRSEPMLVQMNRIQ